MRTHPLLWEIINNFFAQIELLRYNSVTDHFRDMTFEIYMI